MITQEKKQCKIKLLTNTHSQQIENYKSIDTVTNIGIGQLLFYNVKKKSVFTWDDFCPGNAGWDS